MGDLPLILASAMHHLDKRITTAINVKNPHSIAVNTAAFRMSTMANSKSAAISLLPR
jgi:hypothetical protein